MIKISTLNNKIIPYHEKVISKYQDILSIFPKEFLDTKPILSGSCAISLVFKPDAEYGDYDFYFDTKDAFVKALHILSAKYNYTLETKNAITFIIDNMKVQLICAFYTSASEVCLKHDFANCGLAIQGTNIFFSKLAINAWANNYLVIQDLQIEDNFTNEDTLKKLHLIMIRMKIKSFIIFSL